MGRVELVWVNRPVVVATVTATTITGQPNERGTAALWQMPTPAGEPLVRDKERD